MVPCLHVLFVWVSKRWRERERPGLGVEMLLHQQTSQKVQQGAEMFLCCCSDCADDSAIEQGGRRRGQAGRDEMIMSDGKIGEIQGELRREATEQNIFITLLLYINPKRLLISSWFPSKLPEQNSQYSLRQPCSRCSRQKYYYVFTNVFLSLSSKA